MRERAVAIFALLAEAEGQVHGEPVEEVTFHEVGAWDSIADIVAAAWLIETLNPESWSCGPLPTGRGRVETAHGSLPLPAPATAVLLEGYPLFQDGLEGERITPTGAAVLRHLNPSFEPRTTPAKLMCSGIGFGSQTFPGLSNMLRVLMFESSTAVTLSETLTVCRFEVDDQTPEDLAIGLDRLRATEGVVDVLQTPSFGKKGRLSVQVQVLARPEARATILDRCFRETTTLGVRWHDVRRTALARHEETVEVDRWPVRVKVARRPPGPPTAKAESSDIEIEDHRERQTRRRRAEAAALAAGDSKDG